VRCVDYSETSQIATFFARDNGKIDVIAKGSKRPKSSFGGPIEVFSCGQIIFSESRRGGLCTLTEFDQSRFFAGLRKNLFALNSCLFAAELVNSFTTEMDPHPQLYDSFVQFLQDCQDATERKNTLRLLIVFQLDLLRLTGSWPVFDHCANCKTHFASDWPQTYFSSLANGFICRDCEAGFPDKQRLSKQAAVCLKDLKFGMANETVLKEIEKILIFHFTEILHRPPKMAKFILGT